jgi:hypothetical protein
VAWLLLFRIERRLLLLHFGLGGEAILLRLPSFVANVQAQPQTKDREGENHEHGERALVQELEKLEAKLELGWNISNPVTIENN